MAATIADIEKPEPHNRWWKIKNLVVKGWVYLKYASGKGKEESIFKIFLFFFTKSGFLFIGNFFSKIIYLLFNYDIVGKRNKKAYKRWFSKHTSSESVLKKYKKEAADFSYKPLISILILDPKGEITATENTIQSVSGQVYTAWEIIVATPDSEYSQTFLKNHTSYPQAIHCLVTEEDWDPAVVKNKVLESCQGVYLIYMTPGDLLTKDALYHWVNHLQTHPETALLYSDEDKMDRKGNCSVPLFKSDWSPDTLLAFNYLARAVLLKASAVRAVDGFRAGLEGEEAYDLYLRLTEQNNLIRYFNKILYRQKIRPQRNNAGAIRKIITETLERRNTNARVFLNHDKGMVIACIRYEIREHSKVSILIPTKDNTFLLKQCVESIFENSTYPDFELIVIDNNSVEKEFFEYIRVCEKKYSARFFCLRHEVPFNFSEINNFAAAHSRGTYLVLLNNDTKVITSDWLECMVEQAQRNATGVVGVKLLYPDDSIQHAGIGFDQKQLPFHIYAGESKDMNSLPVNTTTNYAALTAACIMVRKEVYEKTGGLDEALAVEFNDIDFCLKVKQSGHHNIYLPYVELYHYESLSRGSSHSSGEKYERHLREKNLFLSRWSEYIKTSSVPYFNL